MMRPDDAEPTLIAEKGISAPSPDGRYLAILDTDIERRNILHIQHLPVGEFAPLSCICFSRYSLCLCWQSVWDKKR